MKNLILIFTLLAISSSSFAAELFYNWEKDKAYRFQGKAVDNITMSMGGMMGMNMGGSGGMNETFTTNTTFGLLITNVLPNGTAKGILYLESFSVKDNAGRSMASMTDIPEEALYSDVTVDRKGNFKFLKRISLLMTANSNMLVSSSATASAGGKMSATGSATAGGQKVTLYAEFDPKTGSLKSGYSTASVKNTTQVNAKVEADDPQIDVLPYAFLELLALPEGDIHQGDVVEVQTGPYKMEVTATTVNASEAALNIKMGTDKSKDITEGSMKANSPATGTSMNMGMDADAMDADMDFDSPDMDMNMDMDDIGTDMSTMDFSDMTGTAPTLGVGTSNGAASMNAMMPTMTADMDMNFDLAKKMFSSVKGTQNTSLNAMGVKMDTKTVLELKLLN